MTVDRERVEYLARRVEQLAQQVGRVDRELTQSQAANAGLAQVLEQLVENNRQALATVQGMQAAAAGLAQRQAQLEMMVANLLEGITDDRSEGPHDPGPSGDGDRNGRRPADQGG